MVKPITRIGHDPNYWTSVRVSRDTRNKLKEIAHRENAQMTEILRYLIDLADQGEVKIK